MKKKLLVASMILALFSGGLWGVFSLNEHFLLLWNANRFIVTTAPSLSEKLVTISYKAALWEKKYPRIIDSRSEWEKYMTVFSHDTRESIPNEYGENDFLIEYGKASLSFRHFKTNRRHQHTYRLHFFEKKGNIYVKVRIEGKDPMEFEQRMELWYIN